MLETLAQEPLQPSPEAAREPENQAGSLLYMDLRVESESQGTTCVEEPGDSSDLWTTVSADRLGSSPGVV